MPVSKLAALPVPALLAALLPTLALAQNHNRSQPGYLVTTSGDTLRGLLTLPQFITDNGVVFRPDAQAPARTVEVSELRSAGLQDNRRFVTRKLAAAYNSETGVVDSTTVMLQHLVAGRANLYRYDFNAARFRSVSAAYAPADRVQYFINRGGPNLVQLRPVTYQVILKALFTDCPTIIEQVARTPFNEDNLGHLVLRYDTLCQAATPAHDYRLPRVRNPIRVLLRAQAGLQHGRLFYHNSPYLTAQHAQPATLPTYGVEARLANNGPWSVVTGLHYARLRSQHTQLEPAQLGTVNSQEVLRIPATVEVRSTQVPVLLRYSFGRARMQPYLAAGGLLGLYSRNRTTLSYPTLTYVGGSQTYFRNDVVTELTSDRSAAHITLGTMVRAGVQLHLTKRFAPLLEVQYSAGSDGEYNPGLKVPALQAREDLGKLRYRALGVTVGVEF